MTSDMQAASIAGTVLVCIVSLRTGRSPVALLFDAALHARAAQLWIRREAIPALLRARARYEECVDEVRRTR